MDVRVQNENGSPYVYTRLPGVLRASLLSYIHIDGQGLIYMLSQQKQPLAVLPNIHIGHYQNARNLPLLHSLEVNNICIIHTRSESVVDGKWNFFPQAFAYQHVDLSDLQAGHIVESIDRLLNAGGKTLIISEDGNEAVAAFMAAALTMQMKQISFEESCGTIASVYPFQLSQELSEFGRSLERSLLSQDFSSEIMMEMDAIHPNHNLKRLSRDEEDTRTSAKRIRIADL